MARLRTWAVNGLLTAAAAVLTVGLAEVAVRSLAPQPTGLSYHDPYGLVLHWPGLVRYLPQYGVTASFNSAGLRDREHSLDKPAGVYRILVLGDSFMEALQVPFETSLPSRLERALESAGSRIEVLNAGVSGWGTDDELRYLTHYGLRWSPDLILVAMTLHNDVSDNLREEWHTVTDGRLVEQPHVPVTGLRHQVRKLKAFLATRFQLYQLWRKVRHGPEMRRTGQALHSHVTDLFRDPAADRLGYGLDLTSRLLARIRDEAAEHGARVALILLPLQAQLVDSAFASFLQAGGLSPSTVPLDRPQRLLSTAGDSLGIPVIDLLPPFREWVRQGGAGLFLERDGHWTALGHQVAAGVVGLRLLELGLGPRPQGQAGTLGTPPTEPPPH